jgi:hypothetical protein
MARLRPQREYNYQPGDIIGFSGYALSSIAINIATYGIPFWSTSHVGIIGEYEGRKLLFESCWNNEDPCVIQNKQFRGTQAHEIEPRIERYFGKVWHYPLYRELYDFEKERLNTFLADTIGTPYNQLDAMRSGGIGLSWIESLLRDPDLSSIFCSEWCCAAHTATGIFRTDNVSRWNPNRFVRTERSQGILLKPRRIK